MEAVWRALALLRNYDRRRFAVVGGAVRRQFVIRRLGLTIRLRGGFCARRLAIRLADCDSVIEPEHDDNGVRFLGGKNAFGGGGPIGRTARLVFD
jgi:hypothetical protein